MALLARAPGCLDIGHIIERGQRVRGLLVRLMLTVQVCREAVSKNMVGAMMRRQKVYRLRR